MAGKNSTQQTTTVAMDSNINKNNRKKFTPVTSEHSPVYVEILQMFSNV